MRRKILWTRARPLACWLASWGPYGAAVYVDGAKLLACWLASWGPYGAAVYVDGAKFGAITRDTRSIDNEPVLTMHKTLALAKRAASRRMRSHDGRIAGRANAG